MSDIQDDFKATAENVAQDANEIEKIEHEKAGLHPTDPRAAELSARAQELAEELLQKTKAERVLVDPAAETR